LEHYKNQANGLGNHNKANAKNRNASVNNSMAMMTPSRKDKLAPQDILASARSVRHTRGLSSNRSSCQPNHLANANHLAIREQSNIDMNDSFIFKESPEKEQPQIEKSKDEYVQATEFLNVEVVEEKDEAISELTAKYNAAIKEIANL